MDFEQVKEILKLVDQSELTEFDLQMDNASVRMSKNTVPMQTNVQPAALNQTAENTQPVQQQRTMAKSKASLQVDEVVLSADSQAEEAKEGHIVQSPLVGVTYMAPSPEQAAFKKVGDPVMVGETLCIVEAMKLMNEIKSDVEGTIAEIFVEDEQVVEYNQPLFRIV